MLVLMVKRTATKQPTFSQWLQAGLVKVSRAHFWFVGFYALYIILSDATHLITPKVVFERWTIIATVLVVSAVGWYAGRNTVANPNYYRLFLYTLILTDIVVASYSIYNQRGMASRAIILYAIPILTSAILLSRVAIMTTVILCSTTYVLAAVKYFTDYFNEGYKAELYIETAFYSAVMFTLGLILSVIIRFGSSESPSRL